MRMLDRVDTKKVLVITDSNPGVDSSLTGITQREQEELLVFNSYGALISQPYGCLMRNVILAIYNEGIRDIYIVAEKAPQQHDGDDLLEKMKEAGVTDQTLNTLNYLDAVQHDVLNWLAGPSDVQEAMRKNKELIMKHPLIPGTVTVRTFLIDPETGEREEIF
ncbi:hypothetical protein [Jeotgalibacillus haloalkalitolerans]|uniref:Carbonic anhydrase n=1 Tax=Jeotgalibacillus haloalkalitolerans TaxID=3104292 RepID=A0ABU5KNE5_9BACL|nr:hypothetical protein [Jeotgalibacillus sp. HH7-29]MDZ5712603.1 hypothetical protein [Jeotgalibacillus sp. HH7-29]